MALKVEKTTKIEINEMKKPSVSNSISKKDDSENKEESVDNNRLSDFNVLETFRNEIQAEHTLISHRMAWYVTSQSFLVAAFAISFNKEYQGLDFFSWALPLLGILLSIGALLSIFSAVFVQHTVIKLQTRFVTKLRKHYPVGKEKRRIVYFEKLTCSKRPTGTIFHWIAMSVPTVIPLLFILGWSFAWVFAKSISK